MSEEEKQEQEIQMVGIPKTLLTKLTWAFPSGTNEQRVSFVIGKAIETAENSEGILYPEDRLPCNSFSNAIVE